MVDDGPKLIAPILLLGQSNPEKLFSIRFGEISRNPIPHQIEPNYNVMYVDRILTKFLRRRVFLRKEL